MKIILHFQRSLFSGGVRQNPNSVCSAWPFVLFWPRGYKSIGRLWGDGMGEIQDPTAVRSCVPDSQPRVGAFESRIKMFRDNGLYRARHNMRYLVPSEYSNSWFFPLAVDFVGRVFKPTSYRMPCRRSRFKFLIWNEVVSCQICFVFSGLQRRLCGEGPCGTICGSWEFVYY